MCWSPMINADFLSDDAVTEEGKSQGDIGARSLRYAAIAKGACGHEMFGATEGPS